MWSLGFHPMRLFKYGSYEEYKEKQVEANLKKIDRVFAHRDTIESIFNENPNVKSILCHGSRNGKELEWFKEFYPDAKILGTDISHTANDFENMVEWDFHEVNPEWIGKFDIIYSNSFDHSYDPDKSLNAWVDQLSKDGVLCVELMPDRHNRATKIDPLELSLKDYSKMIEDRGFDIISAEPTPISIDDSKSTLTMSIRKKL